MGALAGYSFHEVQLRDVEGLRRLQVDDLYRHVDSYFEMGIVDRKAKCVVVSWKRQPVGYLCIGTQGTFRDVILQYYLLRDRRQDASIVLEALRKEYACRSWLVCTQDSFAFPLMLDMDIPHSVCGYSFSASDPTTLDEDRSDRTAFAVTGPDELEAAYALFSQDNFYNGDIDGVRKDIEARNLLSLHMDGDLVGIGFAVKIIRTPAFADVGMIVSPPYRRQGWGTHIIQSLIVHCHRAGLVPTACCGSDNSISRKTLEKAGFYLDGCQIEAVFH